MSVDGRVAIVTGGAVGVGRAFVAALAAGGAKVTICDTRDDVSQVAQELGATGVQADVSVPEDVRRVVDGVVERHGTVDILISNAGVMAASEPTDDWDKALADYDFVLGTNLRGVYLFGRAVAPIMAAAGRGDIVNVSTDHVHHCGFPDHVDHADAQGCPWSDTRRPPGWVGCDLYDASKWALNGLTQNWARSLRPSGVRVNNVCIGATDSLMMRGYAGFSYEPGNEPPAALLDKWMPAEAVAQVVLDLIAEGPEGRSGDNIGLWVGHPTRLPAPSDLLNLSPSYTAQDTTTPLFAYMAG